VSRAILFDLDGTLAETVHGIHAALAEVLAPHGVPAPDLAATRRMIGDGARMLVVRALEAAAAAAPDPDTVFAAFLERYGADPAAAAFLFPGVAEVLAELTARGDRLAVCTNKPQLATERLLAALGIADRFAAVVGGDALPVRKPDPGHLRAALERIGGTAARAVMVGDSRNDVLAARALAIPCVLVSWGYGDTPAAELGADRVIDDFRALPPLLDRLCPSA
jgi:phosphoglycolate phosphatase